MSDSIFDRPTTFVNRNSVTVPILAWKSVATVDRNRSIEAADECVLTVGHDRFIALTAEGETDRDCGNIADVQHGVKVIGVEGLPFVDGSAYCVTSWCACHQDHPLVRPVVEAAGTMTRARQDWKFAKKLDDIIDEFGRTLQAPEGFWPAVDLQSYEWRHGQSKEHMFLTWLLKQDR